MGLEPLSYGLEATMGSYGSWEPRPLLQIANSSSRWTTLDDFVQYDDTNKVELPRIL